MWNVDQAKILMDEKGITFNSAFIEVAKYRPNSKDFQRFRDKYGDSSQQKINHSWIIGRPKVTWMKEQADGTMLRSILAEHDWPTQDEIEDWLKSFFDDYKLRKVEAPKPTKTSKKALRIILSDIHVGLDPNPKGNWLFQYEYNKEVFMRSVDDVIQTILDYKKVHGVFDKIIFHDLGDWLDWWNGETTRGWHKLDQNMNNREMFLTYVEAWLHIMDNTIKSWVAKNIEFYFVGNDNHAGEFGQIAHDVVDMMCKQRFGSQVTTHRLTRFMQHYTFGDHCFILTHGKDANNMKWGLPLNLNDKTINFINQYIDHYGINSKYIHVEKWDLHQRGFNKVKKFEYVNFPSFAPWSNWVGHNFGDSYSEYTVQVVEPNSLKGSWYHPYPLEYKVK